MTPARRLGSPIPFFMARTPESFVRARREAWTRLDDLVEQAQKSGVGNLTDAQLQELGILYRRSSADLARAQTRYSSTRAGQELVRSLNALVLRAHAQIYSAPAPAPFSAWDFFLYGFPAAFRSHWRPILLAAFFMFGPGLAAYMAVVTNPASTNLFVDEGVRQEVRKRAKGKIITGWGGNTSAGGMLGSPEANSSYIMTNNIRVTLLAVALGFTAGLGTAFVLIQNGLMIGGLSGVATNENVDLLFWAVILPHGILELTAICISGGAGLLLARAIYAPGNLPRRDALRLAGNEAGKLLAGVALMLLVAGLIEGYFTPTALQPQVKLTFALATGLIMLAWLGARPRKLAQATT